MEVSYPCSASSFLGRHTTAPDLWGWLKSSHKAPQSQEHGALGPSEQPLPSRTPHCARIVVFPVPSAPDDVDPEAAVGGRKADPLDNTHFSETSVQAKEAGCAYILAANGPCDGNDPVPATHVRSGDEFGSPAGTGTEVHEHTSVSQGPRPQLHCSCCTDWAVPPCSQAPLS